jgi:hypothetical protein
MAMTYTPPVVQTVTSATFAGSATSAAFAQSATSAAFARSATSTVFAASAGAVAGLLGYVYAVKTGDESRTQQSSLSADSALTIPIGASQVWALQYHLVLDAPTAQDFRFSVVAPAGATGWYGGIRFSDAAADAAGEAANWSVTTTLTTGDTRFIGGAGAGTLLASPLEALVSNGATSGAVELWWAQEVSGATASILKKDSYVVGRRLA